MELPLTPSILYVLWECICLLRTSISSSLPRGDLEKILFQIYCLTIPYATIENSIEWGLEKKALIVKRGNKIALSSELVDLQDDFSFLDFSLKILNKHILAKKPYWLAFPDDDYEVFTSIIPNEWKDLFLAANLLDFSSGLTLSWWRNVFEQLDERETHHKKEVGRYGEMLTIAFERERLEKCIIRDFQTLVLWVSQLSDSFGYDISSVTGNYSSINPRKKIKIEVKSTVSTNPRRFRFYISRNEWETAMKEIEDYYFYFWYSVDVSNMNAHFPPTVVRARDIVSLAPIDHDRNNIWTEAQIVLDLNQYC